VDLKGISRRLLEEPYGEGRFDAIAEHVDPDVRVHDHAIVGELEGHAGMKTSVAALRHAIPNLSVRIESQIAEGDQVASRFCFEGTNSGGAVGIPAGEAPEEGAYSFPPSGGDVSLSGMAVDRFAEGRHAERWLEWDNAGLMRVVGLLPEYYPRDPLRGGGSGFGGGGGIGGRVPLRVPAPSSRVPIRVPPPNAARPPGQPPSLPRPAVPAGRPGLVPGPHHEHPHGVPWVWPGNRWPSGNRPPGGPFAW
jgi:predicted ester cyclase